MWSVLRQTFAPAVSAISAVATVLLLILDGLAVFEAGTPVWAYLAAGASAFFAATGWMAYSTYRLRTKSDLPVTTDTSTRAVLTPQILRRLVQDQNSRQEEHARLAERDTYFRRLQLVLAMQQMLEVHGHVDLQGLLEARRTEVAFNADNCWSCGKPRFQKGDET